MRAISLQSGSNGNCIYVEAGNSNLLFDAGLCGREAEHRLAYYGRNIRNVDAVIISHDHSDHIRYAGVYQRKYGLPVYLTPDTLKAASHRHRLGRMDDLHIFFAGGKLEFGDISVQTVPTLHDGADGVAFVIVSGEKRLGILTDLGHVSSDLAQLVASLDAVFIESNYDPEMLSNGPYPAFLKHRIQGPGGHLSNRESAELLGLCGGRLKWACLSHLSENNNRPDIAFKTHRMIVDDALTLYIASRYAASGIFSL